MTDYRTPRALKVITGLDWTRKHGQFEYRLPSEDVEALQARLTELGITSSVMPGHETNPRQNVVISDEEATKALALAEEKGGIGYHGVRKTAQHRESR